MGGKYTAARGAEVDWPGDVDRRTDRRRRTVHRLWALPGPGEPGGGGRGAATHSLGKTARAACGRVRRRRTTTDAQQHLRDARSRAKIQGANHVQLDGGLRRGNL